MESHLLQMRGLKLTKPAVSPPILMSHLLQMRGLKPVKNNSLIAFRRRIFYRCVD